MKSRPWKRRTTASSPAATPPQRPRQSRPRGRPRRPPAPPRPPRVNRWGCHWITSTSRTPSCQVSSLLECVGEGQRRKKAEVGATWNGWFDIYIRLGQLRLLFRESLLTVASRLEPKWWNCHALFHWGSRKHPADDANLSRTALFEKSKSSAPLPCPVINILWNRRRSLRGPSNH